MLMRRDTVLCLRAPSLLRALARFWRPLETVRSSQGLNSCRSFLDCFRSWQGAPLPGLGQPHRSQIQGGSALETRSLLKGSPALRAGISRRAASDLLQLCATGAGHKQILELPDLAIGVHSRACRLARRHSTIQCKEVTQARSPGFRSSP